MSEKDSSEEGMEDENNNNSRADAKRTEIEQEMECVEEGWTHVLKNGKHFTK
jgi:hypothetical protein